VYENEHSVFHSNSAKLRLLGQRVDKLVPSIDSNLSDIILCYWLNYRFLQCWNLMLLNHSFRLVIWMNRLCSLTFDFPNVVQQHISGALVDLIPSLSALHLRMRQWKN